MLKSISRFLVLIACLCARIAPGQSSLDDGLVAYYPFNGDAEDASGNGNDGYVNGATFEAFAFGRHTALRFDGTAITGADTATTYVQVPEDPSLEPADELSISLWCFGRPGPVGGNYGTMLRKEDACSPGYIIRCFNSVDHNPVFEVDPDPCNDDPNGSSASAFEGFAVTGVAWHHLVGTYSDNSGWIRTYIDGTQVSQSSFSALQHTGDLYIGGGETGGDGAFSGLMAEVRIYNRELQPSEVRALYDCGQAILLDGVAAYYPFNGDANDASTNDNNGEVSGAVFQTYGFGSQLAIAFDGTTLTPSGRATTFVQVPESESLEPENALSISLWCNGTPDSAPNTLGTMLRKAVACDPGYLIRTHGSGVVPIFEISGGCTSDPSGNVSFAAIPGASWHHLVATYSTCSGVIQTYMDGNPLDQELFSSPIANSGDLFIGGANMGDGDGGFVGLMKEVRIYNRELCAAEVQELYTLTQLTLPVTPRIAASGDSVTLTWNTIPGRAYQAQYATTLSPANWQPLADVVAATFSAAASDSIDPVQNRFYRILLQP